jgi:hypothetical protein
MDGAVPVLFRQGVKAHPAAPNDAPLKRKSIGWIPKVESTFGIHPML